MNRNLFILISLIFFALNCFLGIIIHAKFNKYQRYKVAYASELNMQKTVLDYKDYIIPSEWENSKKTARDYFKKATKAKTIGKKNGLISVTSIVIYGLLFFLFYRKKKVSVKQFGLVVLNISLVLLVIGITIPMLEFGAFLKNQNISIAGISKSFDGKVYLLFQCKSIMGVIQTLFQNNNFIVAFALFTFSVIFPFSKLILFYYYLLSNKMDKKFNPLKVASYLGKYSMADVFVASTFLAFLSFSSLDFGIKTESTTLLGLYFFLGYCILSIATYFIIQKKIRIKENPKTISSLDEKF
ncbi:MAG: paraquat-inducible protein A [Flavobacteriales bacterium]